MAHPSLNSPAGYAVKPPLGLVLALLILFLWQLHASPLFDVDEGAFAQSSKEMLASGDWGHTTLNGSDRFDKPILVYWLQAGLMQIIGPYDWVARLPSALAVLAALFFVFHFCARQINEVVAVRSTLILGSTLGFLSIGRAATADGLLNALLIATTLNLWLFASTQTRTYLSWAYVWCALGLLTKGPIAVLVPGATLILWSVWSDRGVTAWRAMMYPIGWVLLLLIAAPWYVYALDRHGMAFVDGFILKHNVERFTGTLEGHGGSFLYYIFFLPLLLLPWSSLGIRTAFDFKVLCQTGLHRFLVLWVSFVFLFFSFSGTKLPHYMLYGLAPMAILMATQSYKKPLQSLGTTLLWVGIGLTWVLALGLPTGLALLSPAVEDLWYQGLMQTAPSGFGLHLAAILCGVLWLFLWAFSRWELWTRLMLSAWSVGLLWVGFAIPWLGQTFQAPFKEAAMWMQQNHPQQELAQWRIHHPSIAFYWGQPTPRQSVSTSAWLITRSDRASELQTNYTMVYEVRGVVIFKPQANKP